MKPLLLPLLAITSVAYPSHAQKTFVHTYFVSPTGNDANAGTSMGQAWKTTAKANRITLHAGDKLLFEGGQTFYGTIELDSLDGGTAGKPVLISSYGRGAAVINAGNAGGFIANNCSYIQITNLHFKGNGVDNNTGNGILINAARVDKPCKAIVVDDCMAEGFHNFGILISCAEGNDVKGIDSVTINNCVATANGEGGISSIGSQTAFLLSHIRITHCITYLNKGIHAKTEGHSGNGIVMSGVQHLLVDHCLAYENGELNNCNAGGPVGIWMWVCKDAVIEHCESHHNHAGLNKDGGGFDIDGGCSNCTIQYCYSHDNEGAGYLLAEYGAGLPFTNNTIRYNISQNDGRKNGYGGIAFWGVNDIFKVTNTYVYNNTVFVNDVNLVNGTPAAVMTMGNQLSHLLVANNVFITGGTARFLNSDTPLDTAVIYFAGNNYFSPNNKYTFNYENNILTGIDNWLKAAALQETFNGNPVAISTNPNYQNAGGAPTTSKAIQPLTKITGYRLQQGKKAVKGINLKQAYGINVGLSDFYGNTINISNLNSSGAVVN